MTVPLYPYQEEAKNRITARKKMLLAMDCGTGKTGCSLLAMEDLMDSGDIQHTVLVVTLAVLKFQWRDEVSKFTESSVTIVEGTPAKRKRIYEEFHENPTDYLVVNYETLVRDQWFYMTQKWGALIVDECSVLGSHRSQRSKVMKQIARDIPIKVGLTGTPLENGKAEALFSQFQVIDDTMLGSFWSFEKRYIKRNHKGWIVGYRNLPTLYSTLAPATVRKRQTDPDVSKFLPTVRVMPPRVVDWDRAGLSLYRHISRDLTTVLDDAQELFGSSWSGFDIEVVYGKEQSTRYDPEEAAIRGEIMSRIAALRMLCDHPDLLRHSAELFMKRVSDTGEVTSAGGGSAYAGLLQEQGLLDPVTKSPKTVAVVDYIEEFLKINDEHKVVLFSQHLGMVDILSDHLSGIPHVRFTGTMNAHEKEHAKQKFLEDPEVRVFISSDAGGYGLNLQCANLLINYDLPWSFGKKTQRDSRIIRASSRWPQVSIESFLMADSLEVRQHESLYYKESVADAILDGGATDRSGNVLTTVTSLRDTLAMALG